METSYLSLNAVLVVLFCVYLSLDKYVLNGVTLSSPHVVCISFVDAVQSGVSNF